MKIIIAPNAFKECLSAAQAAEAIVQGIRTAAPHAECIQIPLADGGDGTVESLVAAKQGEWVTVTVKDPLMRPVKARYGLLDEGKAAVIEMAEASGLRLLSESEKNPLKTTTFGTGELIAHALNQGVQRILIGIGGSATTDAGIGMAAALGYRFLDAEQHELHPNGESMNLIAAIDATAVHPRLRGVSIHIACDVTNPLLGADGAAPVYGPQKGASPQMVSQLEAGLSNTADCIRRTFKISVDAIPGGGAAGGLGAGLMAFCGAEIHSGFRLIAEMTRLEEYIQHAEWVVTGEGKIDSSTGYGKVPHGVGLLGKKHRVPVIALAGKVGKNIDRLHQDGITAVFAIQDGPLDLQASLQQAAMLLRQTSKQVTQLWLAKK